MTFSPTSATSAAGARSPEEQFRVVRRRNRVPLSCYPCRTRKLKCDRQHPCANCVKREGADASSCSYASPARKKTQPTASQPGGSPDDMQNRIDRLESLVLSLMHGGSVLTQGAAQVTESPDTSNTTGSSSISSGQVPQDAEPENPPDGVPDGDRGAGRAEADSDTDDGLAASLGVLKVDYDRGKSMYVGQQHWHTILSDIAEVRNYFASHKKDLERSYEKVLSSKPTTARDGPTFLLGAHRASDIELRAELPPKSSVLTLCGRYFNSMDNAVNIIHAPTFNQQLQAHWQDPSRTPITWLGLLYSVLCLAMLSYHKVGDEPAEWRGRSLDLAAEYRLRTVQCLIAGDYTRPADYTVETLILYLFGEHSSRWDAEFGMWLISSLIARIAFRMGYHRDAKWFPSITPFQAEMRRRAWSMVRMCDVMFSHQVSLPTMISDDDCDAQLPSNIFDEEFGPDTKVLPPSRPPSEATPIAYMITKTRLCIELGRILHATSKVGKPVPYDDILRHDDALDQLKAKLPPHLQMQSLDGNRDPVTVIIARFNIEILLQKMVCLLHRKYLRRARFNPRYAHSRRKAIEAAAETLDHLCTLHRESQPSGRLRSLRWHVNGTATKDFLLPAMLIAVELHFDCQVRQSAETAACPFWDESQTAQMIGRLQTIRNIWGGLAGESVEAVKAFNILTIMLDKIAAVAQARSGAILALSSPNENMDVSGTCFAPSNLRRGQNASLAAGLLSNETPPNPLAPNPDRLGAGSSTYSIPSEVECDTVEMLPTSNQVFFDGPNARGILNGIQDTGFIHPSEKAPISLFNALSDPLDPSATFDWETVENYAQSANWGSDQNFQFFATSTDQQMHDEDIFPGQAAEGQQPASSQSMRET